MVHFLLYDWFFHVLSYMGDQRMANHYTTLNVPVAVDMSLFYLINQEHHGILFAFLWCQSRVIKVHFLFDDLLSLRYHCLPSASNLWYLSSLHLCLNHQHKYQCLELYGGGISFSFMLSFCKDSTHKVLYIIPCSKNV